MKYQNQLRSFIKTFIPNSSERINEIFGNILLDSQKRSYEVSEDIQLFDVSYEIIDGEVDNDIQRFSYFGTQIDFLNFFSDTDFKISLLQDEYYKFKDELKEGYVTISFSCRGGELEHIKIYFDIIDHNREVVLVACSLQGDKIFEAKKYYPYSHNKYVLSRIHLRNNPEYKKYAFYTPFDVLFRYKKNKLSTIKYYYEDTYDNRLIFQDVHKCLPMNPDIYNKDLNIKSEIGIDFDLREGIRKINYYIGLYK